MSEQALFSPLVMYPKASSWECSYRPIGNFLNKIFSKEWLLQLYFSQICYLNRYVKHENPFFIYEDIDYFQIM